METPDEELLNIFNVVENIKKHNGQSCVVVYARKMKQNYLIKPYSGILYFEENNQNLFKSKVSVDKVHKYSLLGDNSGVIAIFVGSKLVYENQILEWWEPITPKDDILSTISVFNKKSIEYFNKAKSKE